MATWIERVASPLSLARRGVLVLVDRASDAHLPALLRRLRARSPVHLCVELDALWSLPDRSTAILVATPEHAAPLNAARPRVASRELRLVLWCTREMSAALLRGAPDFFDWISHRVECPSGLAPHLLAGIAAAKRAKIPGALVTGVEALDEEATEMLFERGWRFADWHAGERSLDGLAELRGDETLWVEGVDDHAMFRTELALSGCTATAFVDARQLLGSHRTRGWWTLDGSVLPLADAAARVRRVDPRVDVDAIALCGGEPGAIDLMTALLESGDDPRKVCGGVRRASDSGAWLARRALARGLVTARDVALGDAPTPALRHLARSEAARDAARSLRTEVESSLRAGAPVDDLRLGWFASRFPLPPAPAPPHVLPPTTAVYLVEALLRAKTDGAAPPVRFIAALIPNLPRLTVESLMARWGTRLAPDDLDRLLAAGTFELTVGDVRRAAGLFAALCDAARARGVDAGRFAVPHARALRLLGRYGDALEELHDLRSSDPAGEDLVEAYCEDARISIALYRPNAAQRSLHRAERQVAEPLELRRQRMEILAEVFLLHGDASGALATLDGSDVVDAPLLRLRAEALLMADDGVSARETVHHALDAAPDLSLDRANVLLTHARVLIERGEYTSALLEVQRAEQIWSARNVANLHLHGRAHRIRGEALLRNGSHDAAYEAFAHAVDALTMAFSPVGVSDLLHALGSSRAPHPALIDHPEFIESRLAWLAVPGRHEPQEAGQILVALRKRLRAGHPTVVAWERRLRRRLPVAG